MKKAADRFVEKKVGGSILFQFSFYIENVRHFLSGHWCTCPFDFIVQQPLFRLFFPAFLDCKMA